MKLRNVLAVGLIALGTAGAAFAATDSKGPGPGDEGRAGGDARAAMHHQWAAASVERVAIHNILAELLSAKTGRSPEEIRSLFQNAGDPHEAVEKLGLARDDVRALFQQAHLVLIQRAQAAGLITAEQAAKLRSAPLPEHGPPPGEGPRGEEHP